MAETFIPDAGQAEEILKKYVKEDFLFNHCKIVSGIMRYFAKEMEPGNDEYWAAVGMLHDVDFEIYPEEHCEKCFELLKNEGVDEKMVSSISTHGYGILPNVKNKPESKMEKTLFAVDELSGLIGACALVRPSKSIADMDIKSIKKKFKTPAFAAGCSRDEIAKGAALMDMELDELFQKTLDAMKSFDNVFNI